MTDMNAREELTYQAGYLDGLEGDWDDDLRDNPHYRDGWQDGRNDRLETETKKNTKEN